MQSINIPYEDAVLLKHAQETLRTAQRTFDGIARLVTDAAIRTHNIEGKVSITLDADRMVLTVETSEVTP